MKMRAALFFGAGDVRLQEVEIPRIGAGEVLIKIGTALTCGSDVKAFRQGHPVLLGENYPAPFGHELAGTIAEVGRGVKDFKPGTRVVAANSAPCDQCFFCKRGKPNLCDHLDLLNGAYAEYIRIPARIVKHNLYEIPDHLSFKAAALTEPLACAVHAFERLSIPKGETVVILGCGIMGLLFSAVAKIHGVRIIAVGRNREKLNKARALGVDEVLDIGQWGQSINPVEEIKRFTPEGRGADFVVEAIGKPESWEQAFYLARKGGTVCLFGGCAKGSSFTLDTHRVHYQEVNVLGVFHHTPEHFAQALGFLAAGALNEDLFVTGEMRLEELSSYFLEASRSSLFKMAVIP